MVDVSEGLTNQRMGLITYFALADEMKRTLVLGHLKTGNKVMGGVHDMLFSDMFDVEELGKRLPRSIHACVAGSQELRLGQSIESYHQAGRVAGNQQWLLVPKYARRFRDFANVKVLHLSDDVWIDGK